jgi:hypothetical protein
MTGDNFVARGDNPGTLINISTGRSQFIIGLAMKTISVLSTTKSNKTQHALIISGVIILFSCVIVTPFQLYGQPAASSNQFPNNDYVQYKNPEQKISLLVSSNWNITESHNTIKISYRP